jgi:hypothetical protein
MRCDACGREIPHGQEAYDTKNERIGNPFPRIPVNTHPPKRPKGAYHRRKPERTSSIETVLVTLCPDCAKERDTVRRTWLLVGLGILVGGIALLVWQFVWRSPHP